jgi:hypothetical protein
MPVENPITLKPPKSGNPGNGLVAAALRDKTSGQTKGSMSSSDAKHLQAEIRQLRAMLEASNQVGDWASSGLKTQQAHNTSSCFYPCMPCRIE